MYREIVLAQEGTGNGGGSEDAPSPGPFGGLGGMLLPLALIVVLMYFLMIRPQRKQQKQRQQMLSRVSRNDHVVTIGGIRGIVHSVDDEDVVLKVDERNDVRIRLSKSAVARVVEQEEEDSA